MGEQENSWLTLQGLADRLEALERENAKLRDEVAALNGSEIDQAVKPAFEGRVSRRALLSKAGAAAVAAMAAGTLLNPREAKASDLGDGNRVDYHATHAVAAQDEIAGIRAIDGRSTTSGNGEGAVEGHNDNTGPGVKGFGGTGVWGISSNTGHSGVYGQHTGTSGYGVVGDGKGDPPNAGVLGRNSGGNGVRGEGQSGVVGISSAAGFSAVYGQHTGSSGYGVRGEGQTSGVRGLGRTGVWGRSAETGFSGVYGEHFGSSGYGVVGDGTGGSAGVLGRNSGGDGVSGEGRTGVSGVGSDDQQAGVKGEGPTGVWGLSSRIAFSGVYGEHTGTSGIGTTGIGKGGAPGVLGRNNTGVGVLGEGRNGIHGTANGGYGGQFEGGSAQLRLVPTGSAGKPTTGIHQKGEIYVDSAANLFVCTANGTPGTWKKIRTVAV